MGRSILPLRGDLVGNPFGALKLLKFPFDSLVNGSFGFQFVFIKFALELS